MKPCSIYLCLTYFTSHNALKFYLCCCKWQDFHLFSWLTISFNSRRPVPCSATGTRPMRVTQPLLPGGIWPENSFQFTVLIPPSFNQFWDLTPFRESFLSKGKYDSSFLLYTPPLTLSRMTINQTSWEGRP